MKLEEAINQKVFKNEHQKAMVNIIYSCNWVSERIKTVFDKQDITSQQFNILRILRGAGQPLSTLQIRQRMLDKMSDTSRIVDRLVIKKLVSKSVCPADKRLVDVKITAKGKEVLKDLDGYEQEMNDYMSGLDEKEAITLNQLLDKLRG